MSSLAQQMYDLDLVVQRFGIAFGGSPGAPALRMTVTEEHANSLGYLHGGVIFFLADTAFAYAASADGTAAVTRTANIAFIEPARPGDTLVAQASLRAVRRRWALYDVTVRKEGGPVVAEFRGECALGGQPLRQRR